MPSCGGGAWSRVPQLSQKSSSSATVSPHEGHRVAVVMSSQRQGTILVGLVDEGDLLRPGGSVAGQLTACLLEALADLPLVENGAADPGRAVRPDAAGGKHGEGRRQDLTGQPEPDLGIDLELLDGLRRGDEIRQ